MLKFQKKRVWNISAINCESGVTLAPHRSGQAAGRVTSAKGREQLKKKTQIQSMRREGTKDSARSPWAPLVSKVPLRSEALARSSGAPDSHQVRPKRMMAHRARPLRQDVVRSVTLDVLVAPVCCWHQVKSLLGRMSDSAAGGDG